MGISLVWCKVALIQRYRSVSRYIHHNTINIVCWCALIWDQEQILFHSKIEFFAYLVSHHILKKNRFFFFLENFKFCKILEQSRLSNNKNLITISIYTLRLFCKVLIHIVSYCGIWLQMTYIFQTQPHVIESLMFMNYINYD